MEFHHVGVATDDYKALVNRFGALFDAPVAHEQRFDDMTIVFLELENGYIELLEPRDGGVIAQYLDEYGPGLHHLAIATDDIEGALEAARDVGVDLVDSEPRPGAWGHEVAFLHPGSTGGVLVEFVAR